MAGEQLAILGGVLLALGLLSRFSLVRPLTTTDIALIAGGGLFLAGLVTVAIEHRLSATASLSAGTFGELRAAKRKQKLESGGEEE